MRVVFDGLDRPVQAIVDTAAQISMLREGLLKDGGTQELSINTAAEDTSMKCKLAQDVKFTVAEQRFTHSFACGPISDDCILGLDFLLSCNAVVDLPRSMLILKGSAVHAEVQHNSQGEDFQISRVAVEVINDSAGDVSLKEDFAGDVSLKEDQHLPEAVELKNILFPCPVSELISITESIGQGSSINPLGAEGLSISHSSHREAKCLPPSKGSSGCQGKVRIGSDPGGVASTCCNKLPFYQGTKGFPSPPCIGPMGAVRSSYVVSEVSNISVGPGSLCQGNVKLPRKVDEYDDVDCGLKDSPQGAAGISWSSPHSELAESNMESNLPDYQTAVEVEMNNCDLPRSFTSSPPTTLPAVELKRMFQDAQDKGPTHLSTHWSCTANDEPEERWLRQIQRFLKKEDQTITDVLTLRDKWASTAVPARKKVPPDRLVPIPPINCQNQ